MEKDYTHLGTNGQEFRAPEAEATLYFVPKAEVGKEWPFLRPQLTLEPELWDTRYRIEEIEFNLREGMTQLWVAKDSQGKRLFWALSNVSQRANDGQKVLTVWWMQGEGFLQNMPIIVEALMQLACQHEFHSVIVIGRKAWERVLRTHEFEFFRVEMVRKF